DRGGGDADLDPRQRNVEQTEDAAQRHQHREGHRQKPQRGRAELGAPQSHRDHRQDVVEPRDRMAHAGEKAARLPSLHVRRGRRAGEPQGQQSHRGRDDDAPLDHRVTRRARPAHRARSRTTRWTVQYAPSEPTAYAGSISTGRGQRTSSTRNARSRSTITATKSSWPTSTPRLNVSSASGISARGSPIVVRPLAKPKPCNRPKANATSHG